MCSPEEWHTPPEADGEWAAVSTSQALKAGAAQEGEPGLLLHY